MTDRPLASFIFLLLAACDTPAADPAVPLSAAGCPVAAVNAGDVALVVIAREEAKNVTYEVSALGPDGRYIRELIYTTARIIGSTIAQNGPRIWVDAAGGAWLLRSDGGTLWRRASAGWTEIDLPAPAAGETRRGRALGGAAPNDVWLSVDDVTAAYVFTRRVFHFNGSAWSQAWSFEVAPDAGPALEIVDGYPFTVTEARNASGWREARVAERKDDAWLPMPGVLDGSTIPNRYGFYGVAFLFSPDEHVWRQIEDDGTIRAWNLEAGTYSIEDGFADAELRDIGAAARHPITGRITAVHTHYRRTGCVIFGGCNIEPESSSLFERLDGAWLELGTLDVDQRDALVPIGDDLFVMSCKAAKPSIARVRL